MGVAIAMVGAFLTGVLVLAVVLTWGYADFTVPLSSVAIVVGVMSWLAAEHALAQLQNEQRARLRRMTEQTAGMVSGTAEQY
jgi:uncharacterized membrane protein